LTDETENISRALEWIVTLLNRHRIPYQAVGGLAAQAYGAQRPLVDIDLHIPLEQAGVALEEMQPSIVRQPAPHQSASWNLVYLALEYQGVWIEIGDSGSEPRFFNGRDQRWELQSIDYRASQIVQLYGVKVAVMPKAELLSYKRMLNREVDHLDIEEITPAT